MFTIAPAPELHPSTDEASPVMRRLRVATHRTALTRQLAEGADPTATAELTLRARQLTSARDRVGLARSLRRAVAEARRIPWPRPSAMIVSRRAILHAETEIDLLVKRLHGPEPVTPQGMALVHRILSDGGSSPLYGSADSDALRRVVIHATAALGTADPVTATPACPPRPATPFPHSR